MNIRVVIEYDEVTKSFAAYCPELPGCASCGDTEREALENMKEAIDLFFEPSDIPLIKNMSICWLSDAQAFKRERNRGFLRKAGFNPCSFQTAAGGGLSPASIKMKQGKGLDCSPSPIPGKPIFKTSKSSKPDKIISIS